MSVFKLVTSGLLMSVFASIPAHSQLLTQADCIFVKPSVSLVPEFYKLSLNKGEGLKEQLIKLSSKEMLKIELRDISQDVNTYTESIVTISFSKNDQGLFSSSGDTYANLNGVYRGTEGQEAFSLRCTKSK